MKQYKIIFLLTSVTVLLGFILTLSYAQLSSPLFDYEQREGDPRPKPEIGSISPRPSLKALEEEGRVTSKAPGWQPNGFCLCDTAGSYLPKIVSDGNSGAIICWSEGYRGWPIDTTRTMNDIYAQRVDSAGNIIWQSQGVPICSLKNTDASYPAIVADGYGGAIIAWEEYGRDSSGYTHVYAQRVDSMGNRLWGENGILVCGQWSGYVDICSDGYGGVIIAYVDGRDAATSDNIYAQRIDSAGNPMWAIDGVPVCAADSIQFWPAITNNEKGGAIITWQDYRSGNYDIYAQMVDSIGNLKWVINGVGVHLPTSQHERYPKVVQNSKGGAIVSWIDYGNGKTRIQSLDSLAVEQWSSVGVNTLGTYGDLNQILFGGGANSYAAQRVDSLGNLKWGSGILLHGDTTGGQFGSASDTFNYLIIIWDEMRNSPFYSDQYVQKIDLSGNILWGPSGIPVCTLKMEYETYPQITSDGLGGAICTWFGDPNHSWNHVWIQRIYSDGTPGGINGEPKDISMVGIINLKTYPNPFYNKITISYQLMKPEEISIKVYNITGQLVNKLIDKRQNEGIYKISWNGRDQRELNITSGIYFIRLETGNINKTVKLIKIK